MFYDQGVSLLPFCPSGPIEREITLRWSLPCGKDKERVDRDERNQVNEKSKRSGRTRRITVGNDNVRL